MNEPVVVPIRLRAAREVFSSWDGFLAFGFGSGLIPRAPGTWGTLVAVPWIFVLDALPGPAYWLALVALFALGVLICNRVGSRLGVNDYGGIVWDEMVGYWLTMAFVPLTWTWILLGFVLFRLFDILKPWPIGQVDRRLHGGLGVMFDDVLAALYAGILLAACVRWTGS
jgi:phosphatidylglycerophosphatase A